MVCGLQSAVCTCYASPGTHKLDCSKVCSKGKDDFDKKITLPLDSHLSLTPFHLIFLDPFFTLFDADRKVHANHEDGWSPHENPYIPLAPSIMKPLKAAQVYRCCSWSLKLVENAQLRCHCALKYKDKPSVNWRRLKRIEIRVFENCSSLTVFQSVSLLYATSKKKNVQETYLFVLSLRFCHLHVISL